MSAPTPAALEPAALRLTGVSKRFGATEALRDVAFTLRRGTVHALLGENGAGKTTLMHVAFGMLAPDAGEILVSGRPVRLRSPSDAIAAGIGMVHQHFTLVPAMTVTENLALGGRGLLRPAELRVAVQRIASRTGFALDADARVETLPVSAQQRVEIAKALARQATVLVLDEPTAVLAPAEASELLRWLREYVAGGNAAVLITHRLQEALAVADDVTVLRRGRVVPADAGAARTATALATAMIGHTLDATPSPLGQPVLTQREVVFEAKRMTLVDGSSVARLVDANFRIAPGEIVGVAAVEGAGQRELLRALAGRIAVAGGALRRPDSVGFIPEDRHHDAVLLDQSLTRNVSLRGAGRRRGLVRWAVEQARTVALMRTFDVRAASPGALLRSLSGGNQQKLVLARELSATAEGGVPPVAIVAENPTRGLDIQAAADVHERLRAARRGGAAVVIYSSDLDEVLPLADRMFVVHAQRVREVGVDREAVGRAMLGLS